MIKVKGNGLFESTDADYCKYAGAGTDLCGAYNYKANTGDALKTAAE